MVQVLPDPMGVCDGKGKGSSWNLLGGNQQRELVKSHFPSIPQPCSAFRFPCKADSTSSAQKPQLSTRRELTGWGKAPWADHRPCRDWHQSCGSTEPIPWQWHEATTQSVTCPDPNPAFPLSMTTKSWRGGSDCQALGWGFGVFVPA